MIGFYIRVKNLSEKMSKIRKPIIDRQGGPLSIVSSIASNPGTLSVMTVVGGLAVSPELASVREAIVNLVGRLIL